MILMIAALRYKNNVFHINMICSFVYQFMVFEFFYCCVCYARFYFLEESEIISLFPVVRNEYTKNHVIFTSVIRECNSLVLTCTVF